MRLPILAAVVAVLVATLAGGFEVARAVFFAPVHAQLQVSRPGHLWLSDPVTINFDQDVDPTTAKVTLNPPAPFKTKRAQRQLVLTPDPAWKPATRYQVALAPVRNARHTVTLSGWTGAFQTQPDIEVQAFTALGATVPNGGKVALRLTSPLTIEFTQSMSPQSLKLTLNDAAPPASALAWSQDYTVLTVTPQHAQPNQSYRIDVVAGYSSGGDPLLEPAQVELTTSGLEPSNSSSGIGANFVTKNPLEIVLENSGPARPQSGLQQADMVFEYISEYNISRMTAIYFNNPPPVVGPVRSCRLINWPLNQAFDGLTMCSGLSPGTDQIRHMPQTNSPRRLRVIINDLDRGGHFFRVSFKFAPHNLYTDEGRALRMRAQYGGDTPNYSIDPPHPDNGLGSPALAPTVPLMGVSYSYNPGTQTYGRFDHGTVFTDASTGRQLQVKNIILMHVAYRVMPYIEDFSGGAHSIWYGMFGSGPADIYSDGKLIHATWHQDALNPVYFTDSQGNFIELNTGLTWIHVLGNGQRQ